MNKPAISVFHNLARSGGTLVSRCIASMENVCLLSEIHPFGRTNRHFSAIRQYQLWYHDLGESDWQHAGFDRSIDRIAADCENRGRKLVLRDWAHLDFIGPPSPKPPSYRLLLDQRLSPRYSLCHCALVRHPAETWRSTSKMKLISQNRIDVIRFLYGYRRYLEAVDGFPIVRYEDFTSAPARSMEKISQALSISYDERFIEKWSEYVNVTGDMYKNSRASGSSQIQHFDIRPLEPTLKDLYHTSEDYQWIIARLGYDF